MHVRRSEVEPGKQLARRHGPSEQRIEFDGDRGVSNVSDDTVVSSARSLSDDDPLAEARVDQVGIRQRRSLGGGNFKIFPVDLELRPKYKLSLLSTGDHLPL